MYIDESPILESVFVTHAPDAADIADIAMWNGDVNLPSWFWLPLSYAELAGVTAEGWF